MSSRVTGCAELTMLILSRIRAKQAKGGFARTFVSQMEQVMGTCLDRGIKVVSNAGGLDPDGCADAVQEVADRLGLSPTIAYIDGDDLMPRITELAESGALAPFGSATGLGDPSRFLTANAYLGCFGIVDALTKGADIVITGRVTDAAVTCGPAAWHHGWQRDDFDQLAGGVVAGHIIECSAQVTGGNYSFFHEIDGRNDVGGGARFGFPWAEVAADGSCVIGKHDGTGGVVNVETVTSQLLYEIGGPEYLGPDVTARFDTIEVEQVERDRVRVSGTRGEAPPATLKVAMNELGGYRNSFTVALTGLDIDEKAAFAEAAFWDACPYGPDDFGFIENKVIHTNKPDPATQEEATAIWRVTVKDPRRTQGRPRLQRRDGAHRARWHPWHVRPRRRPERRVAVRGLPASDGARRPGPAVRPRQRRHHPDRLRRPRCPGPWFPEPRSPGTTTGRGGLSRADGRGAVGIVRRDALGRQGRRCESGRLRPHRCGLGMARRRADGRATPATAPGDRCARRRSLPVPESPLAQLRGPWTAPGRRRRVDPPGRAGEGAWRVAARARVVSVPESVLA